MQHLKFGKLVYVLGMGLLLLFSGVLVLRRTQTDSQGHLSKTEWHKHKFAAHTLGHAKRSLIRTVVSGSNHIFFLKKKLYLGYLEF